MQNVSFLLYKVSTVRQQLITAHTYGEKLAHFLLENFVVDLQKDTEDDPIHL